MLNHFVPAAAILAAALQPCPNYYEPQKVEATARAVYAGTPALSDLRRLGHMEACLDPPGTRGQVVAYDRHQGALRKARLRARATSPSSSVTAAAAVSSATVAATVVPAAAGWAIPAYIVMCESGGNWQAVNATSGAGGAYQIMPSTWLAYGGTGLPQDASPAEQSAIAAKIWASAGASAWSCAR